MRHVRQLTAGVLARLGSASLALTIAMACSHPQPGESSQARPLPPASASAAAPVGAVTVVDTVTRGWSIDTSYSYRLKLTTTIAMGDGPKSFDFDLTGNAVVIPASVTDDQAVLYVSIPDATIVTRIRGTEPDFDKAAADVRGTGIFFTLSKGKLGELRIPNHQSPLATNSYRAVASALQFAHAKSGESRYGTEEFDTTGRAAVEYEAEADRSLWKKKKLRYVDLLGVSKPIGTANIPLLPRVTSEAHLRLAPSGRPLSVELHEAMLVSGAQVPLRSEVALSLSSGPEQPGPSPAPDWKAKLASAQPLPAAQAVGTAAPIEDLDSARIGALDFDQILKGLEDNAKERSARAAARELAAQGAAATESDAETEARETELHEDSRFFFALAALLRRDPRLIQRAVAAVHAKSPAAVLLLDALSSSGTTAAQDALASLTEAKDLDGALRNHAYVALTRTPIPSNGSVLALKALLRRKPFDERGLYGLGTFARRLRDEGKTQQSNAIGEFLLARLKEAKDDMYVVRVLRSIANSGYTRALPRVIPYLTDEREKVRGGAVRALQSMQDPQIDGILATRLRDDESSVVRLAVVDAAQVREASPVLADAMASVSTEAADSHVRFRAVELMIRWLPQRPGLRATLELIAKNDAEPKVRNRAGAAL